MTPVTHNLRAEEAVRAMTLADERAERAWEMLDAHPEQRAQQAERDVSLVSQRLAAFIVALRRGGSYALGSGMVPGAEGPILPSEAQLCAIVAREWMNSCGAMWRFVDAQKGVA